MKYCKLCVTPDTRPNVEFDSEGVCSACTNFRSRPDINWEQRYKSLLSVVEGAKSKGREYDCLIPVSGGKDSTWQVLKCLELGLKPLAMTWRPPGRTAIGQANLDNLIRIGVDHIDFSVNPKVEKKLTLSAFEKYGTAGLPMHLALFNIPLKIAVNYNIPLIVWGENSAFEYGRADQESTGFKLDSNWKKNYGVSHGTTAEDWISEDITKKDLAPYFGPSDKELEQKGILAVFLGYYIQWDPELTYEAASKHGFKVRSEGPKTGYYKFADIDDDFISIHHFLKWHKFGFTRIFDNLSLEIRNGRITRQRAVEIIRETGDQTPHEDIEKFCSFLNISKTRFDDITEKFRNHSVWTKESGTWKIRDFLIPDWKW